MPCTALTNARRPARRYDFFEVFPTGTTAANIAPRRRHPPDPTNPGVVGHPERIAAAAVAGCRRWQRRQAISAIKDTTLSTGYTINQIQVADRRHRRRLATADTQAKAQEPAEPVRDPAAVDSGVRWTRNDQYDQVPAGLQRARERPRLGYERNARRPSPCDHNNEEASYENIT